MPTLQDQLRANKAKILKQNDEVATREAGIKAADKKSNDDYEKAKKEYESALANEQNAAAKAAAEKAAAEKAAAQKPNAIKAVNRDYDAKINSLGSPPPKYVQQPKYSVNRYTGKKTLIGYTREPNYAEIQDYARQKAKLNRERRVELQKVQLTYANIPSWAKAKALREYGDGSGFTKTSLTSIAAKHVTSKEAKDARSRTSSATTAKSNAVKARTATAMKVKELESKKDSFGTARAIAAPTPGKNSGVHKVATKTRPGVKPSSYFSKVEKTPASIIGKTPVLSNAAVLTFEQTQFQQEKLHKEVTNSRSYKDAIGLREDAMEKNPYVGTANQVFYKGEKRGSSGVVIEKKLNAKLTELDPSPLPEILSQEIPTNVKLDISHSQNIPKPETKTSYYVPGNLDYVFSSNDLREKNRAEEIKAAGGTYGDYLKTVDMNSLDSQIKLVGKGAKRAFNSYTSLVGLDIIPKGVPDRHSLIDYVFTDTYNSLYEPVLKPAKKGLEGLGLNIPLEPAPKNPKPFEQTSKAFNERTPAENLGDIVTVGTIEAGIFAATGGLGNLGIHAATKLPYLLKGAPKVTKVVKAAEKESKLTTITLEDGSKVKLQNFDYAEPAKKPTKKKQINPAPGIPTKKIKLGGKTITVIDNDFVPKTPKAPKKQRHITDNKLGRLLAKNISLPSKDLFIDAGAQTAKTATKKKGIKSKVINNIVVRKIATKRLPKKDKPKPIKGESGQSYARASESSLSVKGQSQILENLTKPTAYAVKKTAKTKAATKAASKKKSKQVQSNDYIDVLAEIPLHSSRPRIGAAASSKGATRAGSKSGVRYESQIDNILKQRTPAKQQHEFKLDNKPKPKSKLKKSYSLLVTPGVKSKDALDKMLVFKNIVSQKQDTTFRDPIKEITEETKRRPTGGIPGFDNPLKKRKSTRKGKKKILYSTWNVSINHIGTIKGAEMEVSGSKRVFKKLDKRQTEDDKRRRKAAKSTGKSKTKAKSKSKKKSRSKRK